jgi:periplasmic nitrate reductase NapE
MAEPLGEQVMDPQAKPRRLREFITFLILAFGIWPVVAVGVVGGFGLAVWVWQMIFGPPGPPVGGH